MKVNVVYLACIKATGEQALFLLFALWPLYLLSVLRNMLQKNLILVISVTPIFKLPEKCQCENTKHSSEAVPWPTLFHHCNPEVNNR